MSMLWRYHRTKRPVVPAEAGVEVRATQLELEAQAVVDAAEKKIAQVAAEVVVEKTKATAEALKA